MLMLTAFMPTFAFFAFFVLALMLAFAFLFTFFAAFVAFAFTFAFRFWHVGFHFLHFLCHIDKFSALSLVEFVPVGKSFNHSVHAAYHLWAHSWFLTVMIALMFFVALLFLVFAAFFVFVVFLFVAA